MKTTFFVLNFALFSIFSFGQNVFLQKNVNHKARHLEQNLSKNKDTLVLKSKTKPISQVDILKDGFLKSIDINAKVAKIDLNTLPIGNYIIQARVDKKRIVMYLVKELDIDESLIDNDLQIGELPKVDPPKIKKPKRISKPETTYYWVIYESNGNFGSHKSMSLEYKEDVQELISKIELELKTELGKNNKLIVYEVYNTSKFMKRQLRNPKHYKSRV